jgi:hypothetical protein
MSDIDKLLHDLKTKRAHGAGNMITHMVMDEAYAEIIRLRAALDAQSGPLAEVAMRERAAGVLNDQIKRCYELGAQHHVPVLAAVRRNIEALPTTFTPAELLAAAMQLPEVWALVGALKEAGDVIESYHKNTGIDLGDASRMPFYKDTMVKIDAALAPFTRKGE